MLGYLGVQPTSVQNFRLETRIDWASILPKEPRNRARNAGTIFGCVTPRIGATHKSVAQPRMQVVLGSSAAPSQAEAGESKPE